jgi:Ser/Thr protein kinase RdoA (MazF antagonist)
VGEPDRDELSKPIRPSALETSPASLQRMSFADLSNRAQVGRLRLTALAALRQYPLEVSRLSLLNHGFNTTFRVDTTDGQKFALRLNVNSRRSSQQLRAETAWLEALSRDTALRVPTPQRARDGGLTTMVYSSDLDRDLPATLFSWLPGKDLGDAATPAQMREVGATAATLHQHALHWAFPADAALVSLESPLMDSPNNFLGDNEFLTAERREVIDAAFAQVSAALKTLFAKDAPRALHADLHNWNLKWSRGQLYVFDFDDSGIGVPAQDLAIAAYYLRDRDALEAALLEGYLGAVPLPPFTSAEYEAVVAGRNLVLLNDLLVNTTADLRALLPRYTANSVTKLRAYLETGVFRHEVPGLIRAE